MACNDDARNLKKSLLGHWRHMQDDNVTFVISDTSMDYPDHMASYRYRLTGDSLMIRYDDYTGKYLVKMKGDDTLVLKGTEEEIFIRAKK